MNIGVKYCGGCNPRYDRTLAAKSLMDEFPCHMFTAAREQNELLLVICGCHAACADITGLSAEKAVILVRSLDDFALVREALKKFQ